jgi:ring-1,2-phenylacetyl-CoA epoxidase subunit PaaE
MAFFGKLFKKDSGGSKTHKGFNILTIKKIEKITSDSVKVTLDIPSDLKQTFEFIPGQYINFVIDVNGKEERRSYSICSGPNEPLAVAVKEIEKGTVSVWFNRTAVEGQEIQVSKPEGGFQLKTNDKNVVAFAAGSGITPILSIAKSLENSNGTLKLFYGNRTKNSILFHSELSALNHVKNHFYLSAETIEGFQQGRLDKPAISEIIKQDLDILKADGFFLCGPEEMIKAGVDTLKLFGVPKEKIHYELFTTPTIMASSSPVEASNFSGESNVKVILDGEEIEFKLKANGKPILDILDKEGFDAPYSCRGGVCCSCKAKVLEGKATMTMNYALTDEEVKEGYILACQAHPASDNLVVSFDAK